jgi:hypothetical protein
MVVREQNQTMKSGMNSDMPLGALTGRLSCGHSETGQTNRLDGNLDGRALNGRFENPATPQPFRSLRFSKTPVKCRRKLVFNP